MSARDRRTELAEAVWRRMFDLLMSTRADRDAVLRREGLTPNDARALGSLDLRTGRAMGSLAQAWGMDRSNATWVVDRLAAAGLVERRVGAKDRRARLIHLTAEGARTQARVTRGFYRPPEALRRLPEKELRALRRLLGRVSAP